MHETIKHPEIKKSKYIDKYHKELNGLIDALLQKDPEKRPSIKQVFLNFEIVKTAVCSFLQEFVPIQNFIFDELIQRLYSDDDLKKVY